MSPRLLAADMCDLATDLRSGTPDDQQIAQILFELAWRFMTQVHALEPNLPNIMASWARARRAYSDVSGKPIV